MRVIAGVARGRTLRTPRGLLVRPTSDRVRQATFNALTSRDAVVDAACLDLFAGTGALGIEALSRGAKSCTFVEDDTDAIAAIRGNLTATGLEGASVVRMDALAFLERPHRFDLALVDPPYEFDDWSTLLDRLVAEVVVIESDREIDPGSRWRVARQKRYGSTVVTLVEPERSDGPDPYVTEADVPDADATDAGEAAR